VAIKGEKFTGISIATWNKVDMFVNGQTVGNSTSFGRNKTNAGVVLIKNNTGSDLAQFAVVGFTDELFSPNNDNQLDAFKNYRSLKGIIPDLAVGHTEKYGIIQAPCKAGDIVPCMMSGYTPVSLKVNKDWHKYAVPVDGSTANMETAPYGSTTMMYTSVSEGGTGLGFVCLRNTLTTPIFGEAKTNWNDADDDGCYVNVYPCENLAGDNKDSDNEIKVWLPRGNIEQDPNIVEGDVITLQMADMTASTPEAVAVGHYLDGKVDVTYRLMSASEDTPDGWKIETSAGGRAIAFNSDPPITGVDTHGAFINDHTTHPFLTVAGPDCDTFKSSDIPGLDFQSSGCGNFYVVNWNTKHSETSNWQPWFKIKLIIRDDNSA